MIYTSSHRINVRTIRRLKDGEGMTLRNGRPVEYKTGWQVAYCGVTCKTPEEAAKMLRKPLFRDYAGIWLENGIYYIDYSRRISSKKKAEHIGKECGQISIYSWGRVKQDKLVYLK